MKFWRMQLSPGGEIENKIVERIVKESQVIGFDLWDEPVKAVNEKLLFKPLTEWSKDEINKVKEVCSQLRKEKGETCGEFEAIQRFLYEMEEGDIVFIHNGATPIALVEVKEDYDFVEDIKDYPLKGVTIFIETEEIQPWFRHFRKIKVIELYKERKEELDQLLFQLKEKTGIRNWKYRGTLEQSKSGLTYLFVKEWLAMIEKEKILKEIEKSLEIFGQIILYGPPGTGKTYLAKQLAAKMLGVEPDSQEFKEKRFKPDKNPDGAWALVQFHPSYNYEDFVRGIVVKAEKDGIAYKVEDRIFAQMCKEAEENKDKKYILIIDEINRANLAAVLGELIYALEYREEAVRLPYEKEEKKGNETQKDAELIVPPNLYIIGTMNTADRSIGHIDYAVRRRFAFVQVLPKESVIDHYYEDTALKETAKDLFKSVENLFKENGCLSPDYHKEDVQPGHSYFLAKNINELAYKFAYQVWPLLKEYCKDGVLICENCELIIGNEKFALNREFEPEKIISVIESLYNKIKDKSEKTQSEEVEEKESSKST